MTPLMKTSAAVAAERLNPETVNRDRRKLLTTAAMAIAAAGAASLFPAHPAPAATSDAIRPFRVNVPEQDLVDLRRRVQATRWPDRETVSDQSQGIQLAKIKPLVEYWGTGYDWRKAEAKLNSLPQFMTEIDGIDIHFIHVRSKHPNALPVIITHGWPGSVFEQLKVIGPLTDPTAHGGRAEDAFDVVIPSMPGYGFSGKPTGTGWDLDHIARTWAELMKRLGYTSYVAQGGDWGSPVSERDGAAGAGGFARHPHQPAGDRAAGDRQSAQRRRTRAGRTLREGTRGVRCAQRGRQNGRQVLRRDDGHAAADDRLRLDGLSRRPRGVDARASRLRAVDLRPQRSRKVARRGARRHHAVLADQQRHLLGAAVLGVRRAEASFLRPRRRPPRSRSRWPSRSFRARSIKPRRHGPGAPIATSSISTRSTRAATSRRGNSLSFSVPSSAPRSDRCVNRTEKNTARAVRVVPSDIKGEHHDRQRGENQDNCSRDQGSADGRHEARGRRHPGFRRRSREGVLREPRLEARRRLRRRRRLARDPVHAARLAGPRSSSARTSRRPHPAPPRDCT